MKPYKLYKVGGWVRDSLLGIPSKDIDYSFEFQEIDYSKSPEEYFFDMKNILESIGVIIYQERPDCFTIRGRLDKEDVDFVMCREEIYDNENSRIPNVEMTDIYGELKRRDFTVNAIAIDEEGRYIDPHNGIQDLFKGVLKCPIDPTTSFTDDPLRMLRALRFTITKGFCMDDVLYHTICIDRSLWDKFDKVVSKERVWEELNKMFKYDTLKTLNLLEKLKNDAHFRVIESIFRDDMWLKPTFEKK